MTHGRTIAVAAGLLAVLASGCDSGGTTATGQGSRPGSATATAPTSSATPTPTAGPTHRVTMADAARCPVTIGHPVDPRRIPLYRIFGSGPSFGDGKLWVGLWPNGVIAADPGFVNDDGSIHMKFPWWRVTPGHLRITGRRLDAPAPPMIDETSSYYGDTGFQPSGVTFPTEGCWQVTGTVGETTLTFVTFVIKTPR